MLGSTCPARGTARHPPKRARRCGGRPSATPCHLSNRTWGQGAHHLVTPRCLPIRCPLMLHKQFKPKISPRRKPFQECQLKACKTRGQTQVGPPLQPPMACNRPRTKDSHLPFQEHLRGQYVVPAAVSWTCPSPPPGLPGPLPVHKYPAGVLNMLPTYGSSASWQTPETRLVLAQQLGHCTPAPTSLPRSPTQVRAQDASSAHALASTYARTALSLKECEQLCKSTPCW